MWPRLWVLRCLHCRLWRDFDKNYTYLFIKLLLNRSNTLRSNLIIRLISHLFEIVLGVTLANIKRSFKLAYYKAIAIYANFLLFIYRKSRLYSPTDCPILYNVLQFSNIEMWEIVFYFICNSLQIITPYICVVCFQIWLYKLDIFSGAKSYILKNCNKKYFLYKHY